MSNEILGSGQPRETRIVRHMTRRSFLRYMSLTSAGMLIAACEVLPQAVDETMANEEIASPYPKSTVASDIDTDALSKFMQLSMVLTGFDNLNADLARTYLQSITNTEQGASLEDLYNRIDGLSVDENTPVALQQLREEGIFDDEALNGVVSSVVNYWYTGTYSQGENTIVATYTDALAWRSLDFTKPRTICGTPRFWQTNPYQQP